MKIALILTGQLRTYKSTYNNLKKFIIDDLQPDIYISTWSKVGASHKEFFFSRKKAEKKISKQSLQDFYNTDFVNVEEFSKSYFEKIEKVKIPKKLKVIEPNNWKGTLPMYYQMMRGFQMIEENTNQYDFVIRMRPDYILNNFLDEKVFGKKNTLYFNSFDADAEWQVGDKINIGDYETIAYSCSVFHKLNEYWKNPAGKGDWFTHRVGEKLLKYHFDISNEFTAEPIYIDGTILRQDKISSRLTNMYTFFRRHMYDNK